MILPFNIHVPPFLVSSHSHSWLMHWLCLLAYGKQQVKVRSILLLARVFPSESFSVLGEHIAALGERLVVEPKWLLNSCATDNQDGPENSMCWERTRLLPVCKLPTYAIFERFASMTKTKQGKPNRK